MTDNISVASISEQKSEEKNQDAMVQKSASAECPVCEHRSAHAWLQAPDRFHGRQVKYSLLRCPNCSLVWLQDPPTPEQMHLHYTEAYHKLISTSGGADPSLRWRGRKTTVEKYKQSGALLDLGCSSGSFLECIRGERWNLYGVEMSEQEARTAEARTGAKVFVGAVPEAPFAPESFDVVTCFDVLEHLYEPRATMSKVAEWLKPGGVFYVQVPNIDSAERRVFGTYWHGLELPRHLFHYSPASLRHLAEASGLRVLSLETRRNQAVGTSLRYVWDDFFGAIGIRRTAVAYRKRPSFAWRAARKAVRMTLLRAVLALAPLAGDGEAIHAIFQKEPSDSTKKTAVS
jgi:SAM-dependent methyltransferase